MCAVCFCGAQLIPVAATAARSAWADVQRRMGWQRRPDAPWRDPAYRDAYDGVPDEPELMRQLKDALPLRI